MNLQITEQERQLLLDIFQSAEKEFIAGIDHADVRDYRKKLQAQLELLQILRVKIETSAL